MKYQVKRKTVLINHTKTEYVCFWNDSQIFSIFDEITNSDLLIRTSPGTTFDIDRTTRQKFKIYWIYEDKPMYNYLKSRYFMSDFERTRRGEMVNFQAKPISKKSLTEFKLEYPEFFI